MPNWRDDHETFSGNGFALKSSFRQPPAKCETDINGSALDTAPQFAAAGCLHLKGDGGMLLAELGQEWRQTVRAQRLQSTNRERARHQASRIRHGGMRLVGKRENVAGIFEQTAARFRQPQPTPRPVEKRRPKVCFQ